MMDPEDANSPASIYSHDLMWVANSPSLLRYAGASTSARENGDSFGVAMNQPTLSPSQIDAGHLEQFLTECPAQAVGRYFESLVYYWLRHIRGLEILMRNEQVKDAERTIGEIDLVFRDEQQRIVHWETAVKYYLHFPQPNAFSSDFVGPNSRDNLDQKVERLFGHQLKQSIGGPIPVESREAFVKGCIFYHPKTSPVDQTHHRLHAEHLRGLWIHSSEVDQLPEPGQWNYRWMEKPHWLATTSNQTPSIPSLEIDRWVQQHFEQSDRPIMLCLDPSTRNTRKQPDRIMIVSDQWPKRTEH